MNGIDFHEENEFHIRSRKLLGDPETPSMIRFLLRTGVAKNEKQALYILIAVIVVALGATIFIMRARSSTGGGHIKGLDGQKYTSEEYFNLVKQGEDPLDPKTYR